MSWRPTMSATSGSSASICCVGERPIAEFVARIDDLDADAGRVDVGECRASRSGRHARRASPRRPGAAPVRPRRRDNGPRPSPRDRAAARSPRPRPHAGIMEHQHRDRRSRSSKLGEGESMISSMRADRTAQKGRGVSTDQRASRHLNFRKFLVVLTKARTHEHGVRAFGFYRNHVHGFQHSPE